MILFEGMHAFRCDRRSGLPLENRFVFYPRYWGGIVLKAWRYLRVYSNARPS